MLEHAVALGLLVWGTKCGGLWLVWIWGDMVSCLSITAILVGKSCRDTRAVGVPSSTSRFHALEPGQVTVVARAGGVQWELAAGACVVAEWQQAHAQWRGH